MEAKEQIFAYTDKNYLEELERKARRVDWLEGYIEGVDDTINHLVELFQADKGN